MPVLDLCPKPSWTGIVETARRGALLANTMASRTDHLRTNNNKSGGELVDMVGGLSSMAIKGIGPFATLISCAVRPVDMGEQKQTMDDQPR